MLFSHEIDPALNLMIPSVVARRGIQQLSKADELDCPLEFLTAV